jgi:hypothetical protein
VGEGASLPVRIQTLSPYRRVYTHSPFEAHPRHCDVALAASRCFEEIWVRSLGGFAAEAYVLDKEAYQRKLDIINTIYRRELTLPDEEPSRSVAEMLDNIAGVEPFVPTQRPEVIQTLALMSPEIPADLPNVWAFEVSPYEIERYDHTCQLLTCLRQGLQACGWRESLSAQVLPRFEPVDGRDSLLSARRPGTQIRFWHPV